MDISVCIPTHKRPGFVEEAIQSCLKQHLLPYEILVGDDSQDDQTAEVVANYSDHDDVRVRYFHNRPGLGQAKNVSDLFQRARGDKIVLLHDDDLLLPNALSDLTDCFREHPSIVAAYGKQQVIAHNGTVQSDKTKKLNKGYHRTEAHKRIQPSALRSAITQQFPNDGYMVDAVAAKEVGYDTEMEDACDFVFGISLAKRNGDFFFRNRYTAKYRRSKNSIGRGDDHGNAAYFAFKRVLDEPVSVRRDREVGDWLERKAPVAVMVAAQKGYVQDGLKWYFGPYHRHRILSFGGVRRLLALLHPRNWSQLLKGQ